MIVATTEACPICGGRGSMYYTGGGKPCRHCHGTGIIYIKKVESNRITANQYVMFIPSATWDVNDYKHIMFIPSENG